MQHDMVVVTHHRISGDVDGEDSGQFEQTLLDPAAAVFEITAAVTVNPAEKSAAHASGYAMVVGGAFKEDQGVP